MFWRGTPTRRGAVPDDRRLEPTIGPLTETDHASICALLRSRRRTHLHLDWRSLPDWLADPDLLCWVARSPRDPHRVGACLGATLATSGAAWVRLAALADGVTPGALDSLWAQLRADLHRHAASPIGVLVLDRWLEAPLRGWGFAQTNAVITLRHRGRHRPPPLPPGLRLRDATHHDLRAVVEVDAAAFEPLWRHDEADLGYAWAIASTFTVAELEGQIVGYQLSTQYGDSGHLARLAVAPDFRHQGIGGSLVSSVLTSFRQRGIREVMVNTQRNNQVSLRLYEHMGFNPTRHSVPVWTLGQPQA